MKDNPGLFAAMVYLIGAIISFGVVFLINGIFAGLKRKQKNTVKEQTKVS